MRIILSLLMMLVLTACGGGGGNSTIDNISSMQKVKQIIAGGSGSITAEELNTIDGVSLMLLRR